MDADVPTIAISAGDPAGIGAEVLAKTLASGALDGVCRPLIVGVRWALDAGAEAARVSLPQLQFVDVDVPRPAAFRFGEVSAACGTVAVRAVEQAAGITARGEAAAMVTCPINKEAVHAAGYIDDIGHQEILARLTGFRVAHERDITRHTLPTYPALIGMMTGEGGVVAAVLMIWRFVFSGIDAQGGASVSRGVGLYLALLGPVSDRLRGVSHLIFVPTGPLLSLPPGLRISTRTLATRLTGSITGSINFTFPENGVPGNA